MADPIDIQDKLDEWLSQNPEAQKYISALYYVPSESAVPADATYLLALTSMTSSARALTVAAVCVPAFAAFLDAVLALAATQPPPA